MSKKELLDLQSINQDYVFTLQSRIHNRISSAFECDSVYGYVIARGRVYDTLWPKRMGLID